ncbi:hypothetical protein NA57DRAFT_58736 [Rhizodiscina lignyota]|uniref:Uncharacterized protein n=1 Tax=Rhizodiscina lignyota TaxID=1504668 RepID=A0A9P4M4I6_9PEZI|nr:hypothetical protein NA57DRAFT_58736 [Rhizodiscina lignyota]
MSTSNDEIEILNVINRFLNCVRTKDKATFYACVLESGVTMRFRDGEPWKQTIGEAIETLPIWETEDIISEHMYDATVRTDGEFGMCFAPCVAYRNGELIHSGSNIFTMFKKDGKWIIAGINDIGRKP